MWGKQIRICRLDRREAPGAADFGIEGCRVDHIDIFRNGCLSEGNTIIEKPRVNVSCGSIHLIPTPLLLLLY
jgi:hypothetical protein